MGDADCSALAAPHTRLEHHRRAYLYAYDAPCVLRAPCGRLHSAERRVKSQPRSFLYLAVKPLSPWHICPNQHKGAPQGPIYTGLRTKMSHKLPSSRASNAAPRPCALHVDDHMDCHGEQPGPAPGGSAKRPENLQGGVQRAPTGGVRRNGAAWCSLALHQNFVIPKTRAAVGARGAPLARCAVRSLGNLPIVRHRFLKMG